MGSRYDMGVERIRGRLEPQPEPLSAGRSVSRGRALLFGELERDLRE
jgi:hypothetical protein